jgi:hypothetical protein
MEQKTPPETTRQQATEQALALVRGMTEDEFSAFDAAAHEARCSLHTHSTPGHLEVVVCEITTDSRDARRRTIVLFRPCHPKCPVSRSATHIVDLVWSREMPPKDPIELEHETILRVEEKPFDFWLPHRTGRISVPKQTLPLRVALLLSEWAHACKELDE